MKMSESEKLMLWGVLEWATLIMVEIEYLMVIWFRVLCEIQVIEYCVSTDCLFVLGMKQEQIYVQYRVFYPLRKKK